MTSRLPIALVPAVVATPLRGMQSGAPGTTGSKAKAKAPHKPPPARLRVLVIEQDKNHLTAADRAAAKKVVQSELNRVTSQSSVPTVKSGFEIAWPAKSAPRTPGWNDFLVDLIAD